jgi:predicted TIM-barrel fold metal-dependent hydrolase
MSTTSNAGSTPTQNITRQAQSAGRRLKATEYPLDCVAAHPDRFRAVLVLDEDRLDALEQLAADGVAGVRANLIGRPVPNLDAPAWRRLGATLAGRRQHLEVQARGAHWAELAPALRGWPSAVVVDHLGLPGATPEADRLVVNLAQRDHVWVKVSAPYRSSTADAMLHRLLDEAGSDRLVWGSDWPWTRHEHDRSYEGCLAWLRDRTDAETYQALVSANPARLLSWSPSPLVW